MRIPEIQARLVEIAHQHSRLAQETRELSAKLSRRVSQRGPATSAPMCSALVEKIRLLKRQHPNWSQKQIADECNVASGRVSEVLKGFRA